VYVKAPSFSYADPGYTDFKSTGTASTRAAMVYVAANDGMLHAFNAGTGAETFAYVPTHILPNLVKLTDKQYNNNHIYFVDGTPTHGDICTANCTDASAAVWKTILVGGLSGGGRGYYALDITDPSAPKGLWEFKASLACVPNGAGALAGTPADPVTTAVGAPFYADCDVGLSFGNPIITKRSDGKWVVLVTSGYNNIPQTTPFNVGGTGGGFLYVLDAATGEILSKVATLVAGSNVGTAAAPSGLSRINAYASYTDSDNTTLRVYGGDLKGNLWRFDNLDTIGVTGTSAKLLAIFGTGLAAGATQGNSTQPITARPELGEVVVSGVTHQIVFVGTGQYLGTPDQSTTGQQSFYAVRDRLTATPGWGAYRNLIGSSVVQQTLTQPSSTVRKTTANAVDFSTKAGWVVDFNPGSASPGERSHTDATLDLGTLTFTTNVPSTGNCVIGGTSYLYFLDYTTGGPVSSSTAGASGQFLGNALATRPVVVRLPNNKVISLTRLSDGTTVSLPIPIGSAGTSGKRVNWREVNTDF
jgi:type IV pilus assembly protein PilY1